MSETELNEKTAIHTAEKKLDMAAQVLARAVIRMVNEQSAQRRSCGEHDSDSKSISKSGI